MFSGVAIFVGALLFSVGLTLAVSPLTAMVALFSLAEEEYGPLVVLGAIALMMAIGLAMLATGVSERIILASMIANEEEQPPSGRELAAEPGSNN